MIKTHLTGPGHPGPDPGPITPTGPRQGGKDSTGRAGSVPRPQTVVDPPLLQGEADTESGR